MDSIGFESVSWSGGDSPESQTVPLIAGFPAARPDDVIHSNKESRKGQFSMETVVYKQMGDLAIHADVYYPSHSILYEDAYP